MKKTNHQKQNQVNQLKAAKDQQLITSVIQGKQTNNEEYARKPGQNPNNTKQSQVKPKTYHKNNVKPHKNIPGTLRHTGMLPARLPAIGFWVLGFFALSILNVLWFFHEPRTTNHEPRPHEPRTTNARTHEPRTTNHEPRTTNHEPRTTNARTTNHQLLRRRGHNSHLKKEQVTSRL